MDKEKDKNEIISNSQGQNEMSFKLPNTSKSINNNYSFYDLMDKKTEKLVTALYMVTDCIADNDAIKNKLRYLAVDLLSNTYDLSVMSDIEKHNQIDAVLNHIKEIISYTDIACTVGFISEMNTSILKREFNFLTTELKKQQIKNGHFSFILNQEMFTVENENKQVLLSDKNQTDIKQEVAIKDKISMQVVKDKKQIIVKDNSPKTDRSKKIIDLIKQKKEVTIKDISNILKDCSEKTIQRELNVLVSVGQVKKTGSKRWSKYIWLS